MEHCKPAWPIINTASADNPYSNEAGINTTGPMKCHRHVGHQAEKKAKLRERERERKKRAAERRARGEEGSAQAAEAQAAAALAAAAAAAARCAAPATWGRSKSRPCYLGQQQQAPLHRLITLLPHRYAYSTYFVERLAKCCSCEQISQKNLQGPEKLSITWAVGLAGFKVCMPARLQGPHSATAGQGEQGGAGGCAQARAARAGRRGPAGAPAPCVAAAAALVPFA